MKFSAAQKVKWNKSTHARRHFTLRSNISLPKAISQIPKGIYFVENKKHCFRSASCFLAPPVGLEPTTCGLTVRRSTDWAKGEYSCWHYLSSRAVARQVLSAQTSLTSVFGMGTGGPSLQSIPTHMDGFCPSFIVKSRMASNSIRIIAP